MYVTCREGQEAFGNMPDKPARSRKMRPHYIKTLGIWGDALEANRDKAMEIQSEEVYDRYMKYLRGCQQMFADEYCDVNLVTYLNPAA